jgi:hypothetical protein
MVARQADGRGWPDSPPRWSTKVAGWPQGMHGPPTQWSQPEWAGWRGEGVGGWVGGTTQQSNAYCTRSNGDAAIESEDGHWRAGRGGEGEEGRGESAEMPHTAPATTAQMKSWSGDDMEYGMGAHQEQNIRSMVVPTTSVPIDRTHSALQSRPSVSHLQSIEDECVRRLSSLHEEGVGIFVGWCMQGSHRKKRKY